ncbi:MAG: ABC transporter ATP-binding protein [Methanoculleus bourgensis]|nr:ABC transporter ATP-binding protein [Methanoculleus bourgensis]
MIEFDQVSLALGSFRLNDVSLTINRGDYYFIVGPSGAGKTVILEAIAGLHRPRRGRILLRGEEVTSLPPEKRRVALVYQDYSLFPHMSVIDNVGYGLRMQGMGRADARREVAGLLTEFGIAHLADRYPGTLSGGEQQRVALARAVAVKPDILLLDEPLSALDPITQEKFILDLQRLHREDDLTIVQVSHARREAHLLATRIAVIIDGSLVEEGEADVVLNRPRSREVASFVGIENILDGAVVRNEDGHATVDLGGQVFEAVTDAPAGEEVTLCIRSDDIVLWVPGSTRSSARNTMTGTITRVVENGPVAEVKVDCGVELTAVLTRRSVRDLSLTAGTPVTLSIKATAVHVIRG